MEYRKKDVNGYTLHLIKTSKFKSNHLSIRFRNEFLKDNVTSKNLIPHILKAATNKFPSRKLVSQKLDSLYGGTIGVGSKRIGKNNIISFTLTLPNEKFLSNKINLLYDGLLFLHEMITNPYIVNQCFNEKIVDEEKRFLKEHFESEYDDKMRYSFNKLIENMFSNELYAIRPQGRYEDIDKITSKNIYNDYQNMLNNDSIDILAIGDFEFKEIEEEITNIFNFEKRVSFNECIDKEIKENINEQELFEVQEIKQGKLSLGFRTNIYFDDALYLPMLILNGILGGYVHSKLFQELREKNSLCYFISSSYDGSKGVLFVYSGIDHSNYQKSIELIKEIINDLKSGKISDDELSLTKKAIINDILESNDNPIANISRAYNYHLLNKEFDISKRVKLIDLITKEQCIKAANSIKLDTIFFLTNQEVE